MVQECLLEEAAQQKQVLETLSGMDSEKTRTVTAIEESKCLLTPVGLGIKVQSGPS